MKNILVAIDFSDLAEHVLNTAQEMAIALKSKLWIVHVTDPNPFFIDQDAEPTLLREQHDMEISREQQELNAMVKHFNKQGIECEAMLLQGIPAPIIANLAKDLEASLIIIGKENHGFFYKALLGSVSEGVLKKSGCPVLVVPLADED